MKKQTILAFLLFFATRLLAQDLIIKNVNILPMTSDTVMKNKSVLIQNGKIREIKEFEKLTRPGGIKIINGAGKYLMPGLSDMHVHLPDEARIERLLLSNIAAGVTQIRIMNGNASQVDLQKKLKDNRQIITPNIRYSHLVRRTETFTEAQADSLMQEIQNSGIDFIKVLGLSNEETFDNLTKAAIKYNKIICGHYPVYQKDGKSTMISMEKVAKNNFKSIEHLAGYIWLQEEDQLENALKLTRENNIYNCPTLDWDIMANDLQFPDEYRNRLTYRLLPKSITGDWESNYAAAVEKAGGKEKVIETRDKYKQSFTRKLNVLKRLYENRCLLLIGSDAGSAFQADGFNVYEEMINWKNAGIDNFTILKSATVTPSQFFNEQNMWGTIETGKNAEMIILKKNPLEDIKNIAEIETTIVGGKLYNNKELMRKL
jgi:hypothetical protein